MSTQPDLITEDDLQALEQDHRNDVSWGLDTERKLVASLHAARAREKEALRLEGSLREVLAKRETGRDAARDERDEALRLLRRLDDLLNELYLSISNPTVHGDSSGRMTAQDCLVAINAHRVQITAALLGKEKV